MREIPLSQNKVALVDDEDYERVMSLAPWYAIRIKNARIPDTFYAVRNVPYPKNKQPRSGNPNRLSLRMHTFITGFSSVDHINHDGLDNRKENLREASQQQNTFNTPKTSGRSSAYKGVSWHKRNELWTAYISVDRKKLYLGYFHDETQAALAYNRAAVFHFGEFAVLNTIERLGKDNG